MRDAVRDVNYCTRRSLQGGPKK